MSKNVRTQLGKVIGKSLNGYYSRVKPTIDELKFKEEYQGRIIDCMVGEVDDNYIETPETDVPKVKLEHSKEGVIKIPSIKGKTVLVDTEGNETDTPADGCRLISVGEAEDNKLIILANSPNLYSYGLRKGNWKYGTNTRYNVFDKNAKENNGNRLANIEPIKIKPNTKYKFIFEGSTKIGTLHCFFYDKNGDYLNDINFINTSYNKVTSPNNAYYMCFFSGNDVADINYKFMLTEDEDIVEYTEHKSRKTEILLNEPLRSLPNGVKDEIIDNQLIRRVGRTTIRKMMELNVNKHNYILWGVNNTHLSYQLTNSILDKIGAKKGQAPRTNHFEGTTHYHGGNRNAPDVCIGFTNDNYSRLMIKKTLIKENVENITLQEIEQWIDKNIPYYYDTVIEYELAEPIIEELPNSITLQGFNDTTIYIENEIVPTVKYGYNALIPYKEELLKQQKETETNTLDIENNIIPYLMDMEFNLMLMKENK